jgi:hypothetical protein
MAAPFVQNLTIAGDADTFEDLVARRQQPAEPGDAATGDALAGFIRELGQKHFDADFLARHLHVDGDQRDRRTLFVEASLDSLTQAMFDGVRDQLFAAAPTWSVLWLIQGVPLNGRTTIGRFFVEPRELLIERPLYGVMRWRGFDYHCQRVEFAPGRVRPVLCT